VQRLAHLLVCHLARACYHVVASAQFPSSSSARTTASHQSAQLRAKSPLATAAVPSTRLGCSTPHVHAVAASPCRRTLTHSAQLRFSSLHIVHSRRRPAILSGKRRCDALFFHRCGHRGQLISPPPALLASIMKHRHMLGLLWDPSGSHLLHRSVAVVEPRHCRDLPLGELPHRHSDFVREICKKHIQYTSRHFINKKQAITIIWRTHKSIFIKNLLKNSNSKIKHSCFLGTKIMKRSNQVPDEFDTNLEILKIAYKV
jgi:hypothetical protein